MKGERGSLFRHYWDTISNQVLIKCGLQIWLLMQKKFILVCIIKSTFPSPLPLISLSLYVRIYVHTHTHTHIYIWYIYICIYIYMYIYIYMCVCIYLYIYVCYIYIYLEVKHSYTISTRNDKLKEICMHALEDWFF